MATLQTFIRDTVIGQFGLFDLFIPMFFIYIIFYTILTFVDIPQVTDSDKDGKASESDIQKFRTIVSISFALLLVIPHAIWGNTATQSLSPSDYFFTYGPLAGFPDVVTMTYVFLPQVSLVLLLSILAIIAVQSATQGNAIGVTQKVIGSPIYAGIIVVILTWIFTSSMFPRSSMISYINNEVIFGVIFLAAMGFGFYRVMK